ncbi:MAG: helix-turn-helix transcriptional regulator [unclassified Hahellaceae]|nr:helix-turn-helix transcriptional regulator [Hahellaceae bacterium]|tara:strand:+ start:175230 stop:175877 length:648 start_codon:yes stop_codon:yes gene_type:complete
MAVAARKLRLYLTLGQRLFRDSLLFHLLLQDDIDLVGESDSGADTLQRLAAAAPGVLVIEENLRDNDGLTIAEHALNLSPTLSILLIAETQVSPGRLAIYLDAGIKAVVSKQQAMQDLLKTLYYIRNGQVYVGSWQRTDSEESGAARAFDGLSGREREVAQLIASRVCIKEIADQLGVSCKTVHSYKDRIFAKLGFERMPELILFMKRYHNGAVP